MRHTVIALSLLITSCAIGEQAINKYDKLVDLDETCDEKWSDVGVNLQRRKDMIPMLVSTVKGQVKHEEKVFVEVAKARSGVGTCDAVCAADPERLKEFQEAQSKVKASMFQMIKLQEKYPELGTSKAFQDLRVQIEGTENRILRSRKEYNKSVKNYNFELRRVSGEVLKVVIGNKTFVKRSYYEADTDVNNAPKVDFNE